MNETSHTKDPLLPKLGSALSLVVCILLSLLLVCNVTIIVKGAFHPEVPPSIFGITPFATLSGSMSGTEEGHIEVGDLIFVKATDANALEEGDVIAFLDDGIAVTHRIYAIETTESGVRQFLTKGDANATPDAGYVAEDQLVGKLWLRLPKMGDVVLFLQGPTGMLLFVGLPLVGFIGYDLFRRQRKSVPDPDETKALKEELETLRALQRSQETNKPSV